MKDHQAWDEFLNEIARGDETARQLYSEAGVYILTDAFSWFTSNRGVGYWKQLANEWVEFYISGSTQYKFKIKQIEIASVTASDLNPAKIGFIKAKLQELHPDITDFDFIDNKIIGYKVIWDLEKI